MISITTGQFPAHPATNEHGQKVVSAPGPAGGWRHLLKGMVFCIYLYCGYVQVRDLILRLMGRGRVVIVYYHRIGGCDVLSKPLAQFKQDLQYLKRHYQCITLGELSRRLSHNEPIGRPVAVVTFDDGYADNFTEAMPALIAAGVPATFFVATGYIGTSRVFPHDARAATTTGQAVSSSTYPKLSWEQLRQMERAGFEIGSHTVEHANLGQADDLTIGRELRQSLLDLKRYLPDRRRAFSFPWGQATNMSEQAKTVVRQAGYYAALSTLDTPNHRGMDPYQLGRIDVGNGHFSKWATRARIAGWRGK